MKTTILQKKALCTALSAALMMNTLGTAVFAEGSPKYRDGTYVGTARGHKSDITVSVTVSDGAISAIDVTSQNETPQYWKYAETIIPKIIAANSTEGVDAVSGATHSCDGIKNAVNAALAKSTSDTCFESGDGSASDPYVIATAAQLAGFAEMVDSGENFLGKYIVLDADIDLSETENWNPIGAEGSAAKNLDKIFAGSFDGRGHTIKGLKIHTADGQPYTEEQNVGLFSTISTAAKVSGIRLENVDIKVSGEKVVRAGGITGDITSRSVSGQEGSAAVDSCAVDGLVSAGTNAAMVMAGGVVGRASANAVISNCVSNAKISSTSNTKIAYGGGIAAMAGNDTSIVNSAGRGDVTVLTASGFSLYAGGVVGMMTSAQYNCFADGDVTVGTIAQADAVSGAGIIDGALMPAASGRFDYQSADAKMYHIDSKGDMTILDPVSHGSGSMNPEGTFVPETLTGDQIGSSEFADTLNGNLAEIDKLLRAQGVDAELKLWSYADGDAPQLTDEVYVNTSVDASIFESGDGTAESPYEIKTSEQLRSFAGSLTENIDYSGKYVELSADIDISDAEWVPVGDSDYAFNGSFDGKDHTVRGMTIGTADTAKALEQGKNYIGFFSILGTNAVVKGLVLSDVMVNVTYGASVYAGGIAAVMDSGDSGYKGAVTDGCSVGGSITVTAETGNSFVGGIAAYVYKGAIINCKTDVEAACTVEKGGSYGEAGGIAALVNRALVANCYTFGSVYGSGNREDEGMAVVSSLVAVNAGFLVNCYGNGSHDTNDYSVYTGALSGWITGIGHTYDCYYNSEAKMTIGGTVVDPVADVGTRVSSGVSDDGMVYTGGVVFNNEAYSKDTYRDITDKLNDNFAAFPVEITQFGLEKDALRIWKYSKGEVTLANTAAAVNYVQPEAEIVVKPELTLNDGVWYGRDSDKTVEVTITVKNGEITDIKSSDGSASGEAYEAALKTAKEKSTYNDKTSYKAADVTVFAGGKGTETEPYLVKTESQLRYIAEAMNEDVDWENVWFALDSDITLTGGDWLPIGHAIQAEINGQKENFAVYPFRGNFDGRDHTITGLTIGSSESPADIYLAGLFGLAAGDHSTNLTPTDDERLVNIRNIRLKDVSINVESRYEANVGGIAAWAQNGFVIDNCSVQGTVNAKTRESFARVGGLVGSTLRGTITDCYTDTDITAETETSSVYAGGLAGMTNRSIQLNCFTLGDLTVNAESNNKASAGGLTGMSGGTNINCYTYGNVESLVTTVDVGGINGRIAGIAVDYECCYNGDAQQRIAGKDVAEKKASGTVVGEEIKTSSRTAAEMASSEFVNTLNKNKDGMTAILKDVSTYLEDMTENNKEGLSHFLFYTADGSDLNSWVRGESSPVFGSKTAIKVTYEKGDGAVKLSWNAVEGAEKYGVAGFVNGRWVLLAQGNVTSYVQKNLKAGRSYKVAVIAKIDGKWNIDLSNAIYVIPNLSAYPVVSSEVKDGRFRLSWTAVDNAEGYAVVYYRNGWKLLKTTSADTLTYTSAKLPAGTYYVVVGAKVGGSYDTSHMSSRAVKITIS
ncbi:The GLUG motif-containing protein [Ruminococcus sp. YE71]|uniref:FMN-binding protein n=1 Tax=unclassified Ruminococcus TaxID=2608920 RepID=UPI0008826EA3|nr:MULTISPECIES: FMN-binding protein [unclassified Ruminococcus]SDA25830.1 The GLUG motif-containing protein [Ruminococcus sp. YE78]SFW35460.1 The GLUG motif-containing protein [Ruminococcus sp. YE71]